MKQVLRPIAIAIVLLAVSIPSAAQLVMSLEGAWDFAVGDEPSASRNKRKPYVTPRQHYDDYVMLPGSMTTNGKGEPVSLETQWTGSIYDSSFYFNPRMEQYRQAGQVKFPFFLTPEKHYVGAAWYRKKVYVPKEWNGRRITLYLERAHIETTVYVNGREAGHDASLSTPHRYDVTGLVKAGKNNEICIRVYNGTENVGVGQDSHSVTDQTQGNWNGIIGRMELQAQWRKLNIKNVRIIHVNGEKRVKVNVNLENHFSSMRVLPMYDYMVNATIRPVVDGKPGDVILKSAVDAGAKSTVGFTFSIMDSSEHLTAQDHVMLWDEFHPNLYLLTIEAGEDVYETTFGLRDIGVDGRQMTINGRPLFLRGTVESCLFPETGFPPTDKDEWLRIFRQCKNYRLNHVRFHSYCPPEAAFQAADEVGIYLQPEGPSWPNHGVKLRGGQVIDRYLLDESKRIVDEYGHHPSFVMMAAGNEPAGDWVRYCNDWVRQMHDYDPTRIYCGASVGGGWAWDDGSEYHVKGGARGLDWDLRAPHSDDDYYDQIEYPRNYKGSSPASSPIIAHEQGQWCAFPDLSEASAYTGAYKAYSLNIFRDLLAQNGMASQAEKFLMASGHLQTLCYKYEIERNLRTRDYSGFQLLALNDYSGQGTAPVGPLNVHWKDKPYASARYWRESCNYIVLLARFPKFVYSNDERLVVPVEAMNALYAATRPLSAVCEVWSDDHSVLRRDTIGVRSIPIGKNIPLGTFEMSLDSIRRPTKLTMYVYVANGILNHWEFWVYPRPTDDFPSDGRPVLISETLDEQALDTLRAGGTVLLTAAGRVKLGSDVTQSYLPVFWNTSWFKMRPPHTTGAYIDKDHPLFSYDFPTDDWANLNWWELLNHAQVMNLMELPADYQPPIQPIDTWHVSRKLGMLIEARVLNGRLLMTTMDISTDLDRRIVARQMRHAILSYMQSPDFQPSITLSPDVIRDFFTKEAPPVNMFTIGSPDELKPKLD